MENNRGNVSYDYNRLPRYSRYLKLAFPTSDGTVVSNNTREKKNNTHANVKDSLHSIEKQNHRLVVCFSLRVVLYVGNDVRK